MSSFISRLAKLGLGPGVGKTFKPFSREEIARLQDKIGALLPEAYVEFLVTYGGSMFLGEVNCTRPQGEPLYFGWFYGFDELVDAVDTYQEVLPAAIIPIGDDCFAKQYCLGVRGKDFGKVYFHDHNIGWHSDADAYRERGEEVPADLPYQTVEEIAASFEQFVFNMVEADS